MEERIIKSDATGNPLAEGDYIIVSIERPGYTAKLPGENWTNRTILHLEPDLLTIEGMEWVKNGSGLF